MSAKMQLKSAQASGPCQRDIAGICIEDKLFPKTNSFIDAADLAKAREFL